MKQKNILYRAASGFYTAIFSFLYNMAFLLFKFLIPFLSFLAKCCLKNKKTYKFFHGQQGLIKLIEKDWTCQRPQEEVIWIHCSSFGEYGIARPIIKAIKSTTSYKIVLTFFSPSGYEALQNNHPLIDYIYYLPLDTAANANHFVKAIQPRQAIFMVSELWYNYLKVLKRLGIPTYLVSALLTDKSILCRWYGAAYRAQIRSFARILTLNSESQRLFCSMGYEKAIVTSDPLFDNVHLQAQTPYRNSVIDLFSQGAPLFIAGSIDSQEDLKLISRLANLHSDTKFVIVPHEIYPEVLQYIEQAFQGKCIRYSHCISEQDNDFSDRQILIMDCMGQLSYLYRYGTWAYVGGGFTPYLHNVLEATVYGIPVAFGPCIERKAVARELMQIKIGTSVQNFEQLNQWFSKIKSDTTQLQVIRQTAYTYMNQHKNITESILNLLEIHPNK